MISVIIPTYNCAPYLEECLESVFRQTRTDFEVIVVDDGSTDHTAQVLSKWEGRVRCIVQSNAGVAAARNAGISQANGEFIAFLDADDLWEPDKLRLQMQVLEARPEAGLVCSDFAIAEADGRLTLSYFARATGYETGKVFARLVRDCFVFTSTVVMRRSVLDRAGEFDTSISYCDDYNLWLRAAHLAEVAVVPSVLATKRERPGNARPYTATAPRLIGALEHLSLQLPELSAVEQRTVAEEISRIEFALGRLLLVNGRAEEARRHLRRADRSTARAGLLALSYLPDSAVQFSRRMRRLLLRPRPALRPQHRQA